MTSDTLRVQLEKLAALDTRMERIEAQVNELRALARLTCEECRRPRIDDERGWQAYRVDLDEIAIYCPSCSEREFGEP